MRLIYLKEGRHYTAEGLAAYVQNRLADSSTKTESNDGLGKLDPTSFDKSFFENLPKSINKEFDKAVVKGKNGMFVFHYVGLYDYVDESGKNLTFFFLPKFLNVKNGDEVGEDDEAKDDKVWDSANNMEDWVNRCKKFETDGRDILIQAIDRYSKEDPRIVDQVDASEEKKRESILELAVRFLRDYLEKGLYVVQRRELELNGLGEIDWQTTIDKFQPVIKNGRPYYMDVMTEQAYSDEDHYITRLQKCLVTYWGGKLEELGLSSVLRVNVPMLSEDKPDQLGDDDFQIAQINRELNVQFVTRSRETLILMRELIRRTSENKAANYESLSFGMTGVHALWEKACAEVLGTELDQEIRECGFKGVPRGVTFSKYMPRVFWTRLEAPGEDNKTLNEDKKAGWRLDFIRTWREDGKVKKLVILDAKYYCVQWGNADKVSGQPGTQDIAKQMFYQMAFDDLIGGDGLNDRKDMVNAFLLPKMEVKYVNGAWKEDDGAAYSDDIDFTEKITIGRNENKEVKKARAFEDINLFTVRIPGISLLQRYANYVVANDWFEKIVHFAANDGCA
jgi:hypothetical protein